MKFVNYLKNIKVIFTTLPHLPTTTIQKPREELDLCKLFLATASHQRAISISKIGVLSSSSYS